MGPNDPFASTQYGATEPAAARPSETLPARASHTSPAVLGFGVGVAFGLLALLTSVPQALAVFAFGALGAVIGLAFGAVRHVTLDFREALKALLGGGDESSTPSARSLS